MNEQKIVFKPYRVEAMIANWMLGAILVASFVLEFILTVLSTNVTMKNVLELLLLLFAETILSVVVLYFCNKNSKITFIFEEDGLIISNGKGDNEHVFSWKSFRYAYYTNSYKGHSYLQLSANRLDYEETKKIVNKSSLSYKVFVEETVVLSLNFCRELHNIEEMIRCNIPTIIDYRN